MLTDVVCVFPLGVCGQASLGGAGVNRALPFKLCYV